MAQKTERRLSTGRGSRDEGREKWEGEIPAEPKTAAIGDWRLVTAASEVVKCRKFLGSAETLPSRKTVRHSLFAIRYSPFAVVSLAAHFYSFPSSPFPAFCFAAMMAASA